MGASIRKVVRGVAAQNLKCLGSTGCLAERGLRARVAAGVPALKLISRGLRRRWYLGSLTPSRRWHGDDSSPPCYLERHFGGALGTEPEVLVFADRSFEAEQSSFAQVAERGVARGIGALGDHRPPRSSANPSAGAQSQIRNIASFGKRRDSTLRPHLYCAAACSLDAVS